MSVSTGTDTCVHTDMWGTANVCVCVCVHLWGIFAVRELSPPFKMTSCLLDVISYRRKEIRKIDKQQNSTQKCKLHRHGLFPGWRYSVFIFFMSVNPINWPEPADSQYCRTSLRGLCWPEVFNISLICGLLHKQIAQWFHSSFSANVTQAGGNWACWKALI